MRPLDRAAIRRREDRRGWFMIGGVGGLAAVGMAVLFFLQPPPVDATTGCFKNQTVAQRVAMVVDVSDRWPETEAALVRSALSAEVRTIAVGDRLTLMVFSGAAADGGRVLLDRCRPPEGRDVLALVTTPARADREFAASFGEPLAQGIDGLAGGAAKETHIVGYLATLAARLRYDGGAERVVIKVFSDMAENTGAGTLLKGKGKRKPMTEDEFAAYAVSVAGDRLQGVRLEVHAMLPPGGVAASKRIEAAWLRAAEALGAQLEWRGL